MHIKYVERPGASAEIFEVSRHEDHYNMEHGFYWWPCLPGCLPDGDYIGPFDTAQEAEDDWESDWR